MAVLITLAQAKQQLVIENETTERDSELLLKMEEANDAVINYLKSRADPSWTSNTVPPRIRAAILLVLTNLWTHRGDDDMSDPISSAVASVLMRDRDPAAA